MMKKFNVYKVWTIIAFIEVIMQLSVYITKYPKGSIYFTVFWLVWGIFCIWLMIRENKRKKHLELLMRDLENINFRHQKEKKNGGFKFGR